jgi:hypothetical protein
MYKDDEYLNDIKYKFNYDQIFEKKDLKDVQKYLDITTGNIYYNYAGYSAVNMYLLTDAKETDFHIVSENVILCKKIGDMRWKIAVKI